MQMPVCWMQARKFLPGEELIQMEPNEGIEKLRMMLKVLGAFKSHYFDYKVSVGFLQIGMSHYLRFDWSKAGQQRRLQL